MNPNSIEDPQPFVVFVDGMDGDVYPDAEGMVLAVQHAVRHGAEEIVVKTLRAHREEVPPPAPPAPPTEPEKPAPECTSAYSTVRTIEGAMELLKDDWELGYSHSSGRYWLQTELCKGGPSRKLAANIFRALLKRGVIIRAPKQANDPFWLTRYVLKECNCDICQCYGAGACDSEGAFENPEEI